MISARRGLLADPPGGGEVGAPWGPPGTVGVMVLVIVFVLAKMARRRMSQTEGKNEIGGAALAHQGVAVVGGHRA
ncbi:hypothetical protein ACX80E_14835 [Arthrobacter sp. TMN-49]